MVNVQTEHLDTHHARLTVDVDPDILNKAMRQAARKISKKARIPGFRPGKAPFNVIVNFFGYEYVLSEAMDKIGDEVYRSALDKSGLEPYGPGTLEDIQDGGQKLIFSFPKMPEVDLNDYRSIRVDYEEDEVTDEMVNRAMENLRQAQAIIEDVDRPAKLGDQVVLSHVAVTMLPADDEDDANDLDDSTDETNLPHEAADSSLPATETDEDDEAEVDDVDELDEIDDLDDLDDLDDEDNRVTLFHDHNYEYVLHADDNDEMLYPGFAEELVGASAGDELKFYLEVPEDDEDEEIAGRTLFCEAHIDQVQARTVPEWSDDLAQRVSDNDSETLLELRMNVRQQLTESMEKVLNQQIADEALDELVDMATFYYSEEFVNDYIDQFIEQLERNINQQGLQLADWLRITQQTKDDLREQYREIAEMRGKRSLVLSELIEQENLTVSDEDINAEIDRMSQALGAGDQAEQFKQFLNSDFNRTNVANELISERAQNRLAAIAKGEDPPIETPAAASDEAAASGGDTGDTGDTGVSQVEPAIAAPADTATEPAAGPEVDGEDEL